MAVYRPRIACRLQVPTFAATRAGAPAGRTDVVTLPIRVRRAMVESNDHNHADTLSISAEWRDAGVDPRFLKNATVEFYLGDTPDGVLVPSTKNLRFIGVMDRPRRVATEGSGFQVELEFRDYTALFLEQKPFPSAGVPDYTQSLTDAWRRICDHTGPLADDGSTLSSVAALRDRLEFRGGVDPDTILGKAVASRFARLAKVPVKPQSDAWAVWQQCVGMLGLLSFIDRDRCVVTTSTEYYTAETAPKLVWGKNIAELDEATSSNFSDKGVAITSFDPLTGTTIEAFYPPPGDPLIVRKRPVAHKRGGTAGPAFPSERYDFYEYHGVTDPAVLGEIAKRAWDERSRQELEGTLHTAEMAIDTVDGSTMDLLTLRAGDALRVEIDPFDKETLRSLGSDAKRREYLFQRGYTPEVADLIVRNMAALDALDPTMHAKRVVTTLEADGDGGKFDVQIVFSNRIKLPTAA